MDLSGPSAYADTFARDHLPPAEQWPTLEFTTEMLQYPERLNAATELIDVPSRTLRRRPPGPAHAGRRGLDLRRAAAPRQPGRPGARRGPRPGHPATGCCCARPTTRGPSPPGSASSRPAASSSPPWPALRARELGPDRRADPAGDRPGRPPVRRRRRGRPRHRRPDLAVVALRRRRRRRPDAARRRPSRRVRRRRHRRRRRRAASGRPPAAPASRRSPRTSTATSSSIDNTFGRTLLRLRPDDLVAVHRAARVHLRPRHARGLPAAGRRVRAPDRVGHAGRSSPTSSPSTASPCWRPRRRRTSRSSRPASDQLLAGLRVARVSAGEHMPQATWEQVRDEHRPASSSTASAPPRCCTSSSPPPATTSAPAPTGRPVPGYRATILDADGDELGARRARAGSP